MKRKTSSKKAVIKPTQKATKTVLIKNPVYAFAGVCNITSALLFQVNRMQTFIIYSLILSGLALLILSISEDRRIR